MADVEIQEQQTNNIKKVQVQKPPKQNELVISFLRAARSGDLDKVLQYLDNEQITDINACNANGLNALHLCAKDGYVDMARELLSRGIKVDNATKKGNTALHIASLAGQMDIIKLLLQYNANVNVQSLNGFTPLYMAAQENHDSCVRLLLSKGANPALATEDGFTPLAVAMQQGHDKVVAVLLESDVRGKVRLPALHIAAKKNDINAAIILLKNNNNNNNNNKNNNDADDNDNVNNGDVADDNNLKKTIAADIVSKSGFTPLHIAAHYGNVEIGQVLIDNDANVNYKAKHNITPLHVACKWGKLNIIKLLLNNNANINATTRDGLTPLHCAARSGHVDVIELLLKQQKQQQQENNNKNILLIKTKNGLAPLHMAAQGEHEHAARVLLENDAPVDDVTVDYLTALHVAAHCGHVRVAKLLIEYGANTNSRALNGFTPLHIACKKNRLKIIELLLRNNANISATTESGLTPLHVASFMGCMNIVIYLLQNGALPDVQTIRHETPLHLAARANQTDIVRILLRNGANVNVKAREGQTPLHVAARMGNLDIISLLLQQQQQQQQHNNNNANDDDDKNINACTKDGHTALHIAAKESQYDVAQMLIENGAHVDAKTRKGLTPLHLAAKYGNNNLITLLLQKGANINALDRNDITPLMVAAHYNQQHVATILLDNGANVNNFAKNGHNVLHIAAKNNQMELAQQIMQLQGDLVIAKSKAGFTPLHLAAQEGHIDMVNLLMEYDNVQVDVQAKNGLTPLHLCAQHDDNERIAVARILLQQHNAQISARSKSSYTPLHVAAHYGNINMVKFLLENDANIEITTNAGYTPLHQAAQQGHTLIINLLLKHQANPNALTSNGQTAQNIAQNLGYVTAMETLKIVTETSVTNCITGDINEKYKVLAPELMHETFISDSEDDASDEHFDNHHQQYKYMANDDLKANEHDNHNYDTTTNDDHHEHINNINTSTTNVNSKEHLAIQTKVTANHATNTATVNGDITDNVPITNTPAIQLGFLVSFLVDARGGSMRGCRHNGVRVVVPPKACMQPTRITCRYVKPQRVHNPPPLMENEALVSRIMELSPVDAKFSSPVTIEIPHFGSLRGKEREIVILRSDNGDTWREHTTSDGSDDISTAVTPSIYGENNNNNNNSNALEDLHTSRIVRIVTCRFPQFFAVVSRIRQEVHAIGPEGGTVIAQSVPQVRAIFPANALTKKIRVGLQAQPIDLYECSKLLGQGVAVSPVVTIEPRRRKFHKAITLSIPAPKTCIQSMVNVINNNNNNSGQVPTLRLLCSITGGQNPAIWEDVSGSTPLAFVRDSVTFTTTVSARFWLMDCRHINEVSRLAGTLYNYMSKVPFMVKFVVYAKLSETQTNLGKLSIFCMTDDKEDKTLEQKEGFIEIAKSRDVEILENQLIYLDFSGNLLPILKTNEQLSFKFCPFRENRLAFNVHLKEHVEPQGRLYILGEPTTQQNTIFKVQQQQQQHQQQQHQNDLPAKPICILGLSLDEVNMKKKKSDKKYSDYSQLNDNHNHNNNDNNGVVLDAGRNYRDLINAEYKMKNALLETTTTITTTTSNDIKQNNNEENIQSEKEEENNEQREQVDKIFIEKLNDNDDIDDNDDVDDDDIIATTMTLQKVDICLKDLCKLLGRNNNNEIEWELLAKKLNILDNDIKLIKAEYNIDNTINNNNKLLQQRALVMLRLWLRQQHGQHEIGNQLEQALHDIGRSDIVENCILQQQQKYKNDNFTN